MSSSEKIWWYAESSKQFGPYTSSELKLLASIGRFGPNDLVWKEGLSNWLQASSVKGLLSESSNELPPPLLPKNSEATRPSLEGASPPEKLDKMRSKIELWIAAVFVGLIALSVIVGSNQNDRSSYDQKTTTTYEHCEKLCKESQNDCIHDNAYRSQDAQVGISFNCGFEYGVCESQCTKN